MRGFTDILVSEHAWCCTMQPQYKQQAATPRNQIYLTRAVQTNLVFNGTCRDTIINTFWLRIADFTSQMANGTLPLSTIMWTDQWMSLKPRLTNIQILKILEWFFVGVVRKVSDRARYAFPLIFLIFTRYENATKLHYTSQLKHPVNNTTGSIRRINVSFVTWT